MSFYTINGRSLDDLIWQALVFDGGVAPAPIARDALETAYGAPVLGTRTRLGARTLTLTLDLRPALVRDRPALVDALTRRVSGVVEIVRSDAPDRAWWGELVDVRAEVPAGNLVSPVTIVDLTFRVPDPRRWDRETQLRALSATPVACPTGSSVSAPTLRLFGAATPVVDPEVVLRAPSGAELARLELVGSLGSNTWLDLECGTEWLRLSTAGTVTNALAWLSAGTFPLLSGEDAAGPTGPYPTLALESASGTPTGVVLWRRSWR